MISWFKKKPEIKEVPPPPKYLVWRQVVEEVPMMEQEVNLIFEDGRSEAFTFQEYMEDTYGDHPCRYRVQLSYFRNSLIHALNNKQEYFTFDVGDCPTELSLKGVQKVWYSYPTEFDRDDTVTWVEEEE